MLLYYFFISAVEEYNEYVKDRPYVTKYEKWTNLSEKRMHHLVEWEDFIIIIKLLIK